MQNIVIERQNANIEALDAELRAVYGELVYGISKHGNQVIVHLADGADAKPAQQVVAAHDEKALTPAQTKQNQLEAERKIYLAEPIAVDATLSELIQRVAWLEKEIRDLRRM